MTVIIFLVDEVTQFLNQRQVSQGKLEVFIITFQLFKSSISWFKSRNGLSINAHAVRQMQINAVKEIKAICSISGSNCFKQKILGYFESSTRWSNSQIKKFKLVLKLKSNQLSSAYKQLFERGALQLDSKVHPEKMVF